MDKVLQQVQAIAEEQHSMVNIEQMMDCGASRKWIERRAEDGLILRDGPSVFRMPGVRRTFLSRAMGAVLSSKAPVLVSHRTFCSSGTGTRRRAASSPGGWRTC